MKIQKHQYFYFFVFFLFLGITSVELFSDGMFMDGLIYADISRNLANGLGSFWKPHFSHTLFNEFYEHPPLAFGLQSLWFMFFGNSIYVERFYSFFTFIIVGWLMVLIWKELTDDVKNGWLPLFFWIIVGGVPWLAANNMLENTMSVFVTLSVFLYLKSYRQLRFLLVMLSGFSLFFALLTKGFFCLYVWSLPFFIWLFLRKRGFFQMTIDTIIFIFSVVLPLGFLYFFNSEANHNMNEYFNNQVLGSINNVSTVDSRFSIVRIFFESILFPLILGFVFVFISLKLNLNKSLLLQNRRYALAFFFFVLSGVLPIMISMKQRGFYINTVYPFFAIGFAYFLYPVLKIAIQKIQVDSLGFKIFKLLTLLVVLSSVASSLLQINRIGRDHELISDCKSIIEVIGQDKTINICPQLYASWSLHGYFSRYANISLDANQNKFYRYYLTIDGQNQEKLDLYYDLLPISTFNYKLYVLKEDFQYLQSGQ